MGKDRTGKYHPSKGKPSGAGKEEGLGVHPTDPEKINEYIDITNRYTTDADTLAPHVHLRHPNRNTEKGQERLRNQQDNQKVTTEEKAFTEERAEVVPEELPGVLSKDMLAELADYAADCCISLYMKTHQAGTAVNEQQDHINFKNRLQDISHQLTEKGYSQADIKKMLDPGYELLRNEAFWRSLSPGLAVFMSDGYFKYIKMPMAPMEELMVNHSFTIAPLVPVMLSKEYFYVLVISKKRVKLFRADAFGMQYIAVPGLPNGLEDTIPDDRDDETTFRTGGRGGNGGANFHGIGGGNHNDDKVYVANYLEAADDVIWKQVLHNETVPLLLAGVEYLIPIYKSVCDYGFVWDEALTGSHEHADTATLYAQAKEKMKPYFEQKMEKAVHDYGNKSATELTSSFISDVVPAAHYGRVAQLFVQKGTHLWGTFDDATGEMQVHDQQQEHSEDLMDTAVLMTILNGGEVFLMENGRMPAESTIAAIMRY